MNFLETYGMPPMFVVFFILVPPLIISPFHKNLKSIAP
jgi:hypothetical protein